MVEQQFGEKEVCFRTLDLYTSAVLEASLDPVVHPKPEWRKAMEGMSEVGTQTAGRRLCGRGPCGASAAEWGQRGHIDCSG